MLYPAGIYDLENTEIDSHFVIFEIFFTGVFFGGPTETLLPNKKVLYSVF